MLYKCLSVLLIMEKKMNYIKKNLANTIIIKGLDYNVDEDIIVLAFDFSWKYKKHFKRASFINALEKKANQLKGLVDKNVLAKSNRAREVYN